MHLSKNGSTGVGFERREQKGVLGPDRDLYGKNMPFLYGFTKEVPINQSDCTLAGLTKFFNGIAIFAMLIRLTVSVSRICQPWIRV
ncbi:hypothetical protein ACO0LG_05275 [Undibacterium sp. Ji42W]|uniref:hypothetical protein n=1 Tax=Undibacterium sp. Ji42W TaxID=3413039 RepID=UPI003BF0A501